MIRDPYGRPVTSIRVSVTQRCNLCCFYCHKEGWGNSGHEEMTPIEIERVINVAAFFGVTKVKLTGGEPLLRSDILDIVRRISGVDGVSEVSMTTNGTLLGNLAGHLKDAGLARVNVSLDTLNPQTYKLITGVDLLPRVISGIKEAEKAGLSPVKVNMVLLKGVNHDQVWEMVNFTRENGLILQLIELESVSEDEIYKRYHINLKGIEDELEKKAEKIIVRSMHHRRRYFLSEGTEVEVVRPMHNTEFCMNCNRIRVTSDGKFKSCLFRNDNLVDFLTSMRAGASRETLKKLFLEAVKERKPYFM